jgi:hypothetical protein
VICARPERVWTFEWLHFERSGLMAPYGKLGNVPHELLWFDFEHVVEIFAGHPFEELLIHMRCPELVLPAGNPPFGLAIHDERGDRPRRLPGLHRRHHRAAHH